jgi:hypothetical protein
VFLINFLYVENWHVIENSCNQSEEIVVWILVIDIRPIIDRVMFVDMVVFEEWNSKNNLIIIFLKKYLVLIIELVKNKL